MIGPEVLQLDMADSRVNSCSEFPVSNDGAVLQPTGFFQLQHIITIALECLAAVRCDALPAFLLKGRGESLGLFSCALFRPGGRHIKSGRPGLELPPVSSPATVDPDGVGDQPPGFVPALLNISHHLHHPLQNLEEGSFHFLSVDLSNRKQNLLFHA